MKQEKGLGTVALILGLLPTVLTASYNGTSLLALAMEACSLTYAPYMAAFGLALSVPGLILGLSRRRDWGAKFGAFLCGLNAIFTVVQLLSAYVIK